MTTTRKHRFTTRKQVNGYNGDVKYYVFDLQSKSRVSVRAVIGRDAAQMDADSLNIMEMVKPHAEDPRPFEVRLAEAEAAYHAEKAV